MSEETNPALLRAYLGARLVALRVRAGIKQDRAARELERGRATIARIEEGDENVRFREHDVRSMLDMYQASPEEAELIMSLVKEIRLTSRRKFWWHDYTETELPKWFRPYVIYEDAARTICTYEAEAVSGLLQTQEYAEAVMKAPAGAFSDEDLDTHLRLRQERQTLLTRPQAPHLRVILNEAVLRRPVGSAAVMVGQLDYLLAVTLGFGVTIRILAYAAGAHGSMGNCFTLFDFPNHARTGEAMQNPLVYVDTITGALHHDQEAPVAAYRRVWDDLEARALNTDASRQVIARAREEYIGG